MNENHMLEEIHQNAEMALYSLDTLLPKVADGEIHGELTQYKTTLEDIAGRAEQMLRKRGLEPEETGAVSKMGVWSGIQWNTMKDASPSHITEMVIQGDTMGITSLTRELNNNPLASSEVTALGQELTRSEQRNIESLKKYL